MKNTKADRLKSYITKIAKQAQIDRIMIFGLQYILLKKNLINKEELKEIYNDLKPIVNKVKDDDVIVTDIQKGEGINEEHKL